MQIKYSLNKVDYKIIFCPDNEGLRVKKNINKSYMQMSKDLRKIYNDKKILLIVDKKIDNKITKYMIHDLKISFSNLDVLKIDGSKKNKNLKTLFKILDFLFKKNFTKKSVIISCGGGVIGDIAGLASSLYLRGLIHFHNPSTMTAVIDSCIGGKTGINYKGIINSLGNYYHAKKVYISKNIISLIPEREYIAGIPEIIKYGLINSKEIIKLLRNHDDILKRKFSLISKIIKLSLETKIKFFKNDIFEDGNRLKLNFGHTFAHAVEMALQKKMKKEILRHGEAVGLGMLCEIYYANGKNDDFYLLKDLLKKYGLPTNLKKFVKNKRVNSYKNMIYKFIFLDKKRIGAYPRYIKLKKIGYCHISELRNFDRIKRTINQVLFK